MKIFDFFKTSRTTFSSMNEKFDKLDETYVSIDKVFDSIDDHFKAINKSFDNIEKDLQFSQNNARIYINFPNQLDQSYTFTQSLRWDDPKVLSKLKELFGLSKDTEIVGVSVDTDGITLMPKV